MRVRVNGEGRVNVGGGRVRVKWRMRVRVKGEGRVNVGGGRVRVKGEGG